MACPTTCAEGITRVLVCTLLVRASVHDGVLALIASGVSGMTVCVRAKTIEISGKVSNLATDAALAVAA